MSDESPSQTRRRDWIEYFDPVSKGLALLVLSAYAIGYLTLALYYSSMGMGLLSPLKPQILAAGFAFLIFTFCPMWATYHIFSIEQLKKASQSTEYFTVILAGASRLFTYSILLSVPAATFFRITAPTPSHWNTGAYFLVFFLDAAIATTVSTSRRVKAWTNRAPWTLWIVYVGVIGTLIALAIGEGKGFSQRDIALWFFCCGFFTLIALTPDLTSSQRINWPYQGLQIIGF